MLRNGGSRLARERAYDDIIQKIPEQLHAVADHYTVSNGNPKISGDYHDPLVMPSDIMPRRIANAHSTGRTGVRSRPGAITSIQQRAQCDFIR